MKINGIHKIYTGLSQACNLYFGIHRTILPSLSREDGPRQSYALQYLERLCCGCVSEQNWVGHQ